MIVTMIIMMVMIIVAIMIKHMITITITITIMMMISPPFGESSPPSLWGGAETVQSPGNGQVISFI